MDISHFVSFATIGQKKDLRLVGLLLCSRNYTDCFAYIILFHPLIIPMRGDEPHFIHEETETQKN